MYLCVRVCMYVYILTILLCEHYSYAYRKSCSKIPTFISRKRSYLYCTSMYDFLSTTADKLRLFGIVSVPQPQLSCLILRLSRCPLLLQVHGCRQSVVRSIVPELSPKRAYTQIGLYKGNIVAIKTIHKRSIDITRNIRKELKQVILYCPFDSVKLSEQNTSASLNNTDWPECLSISFNNI